MSAHVSRIVALGASNLTRGFQSIVATARASWGPDVEVLAAFGHGRSYGARSRVLFRTLPGVLDSGLWAALDARPRRTTRALVMDVGNDILYGCSGEQTLALVEEALRRLQRVTEDIVLTDLPLSGIRRLSKLKFLAFRSVLFPSSRLSFGQVLDTAERVSVGLAALSAASGAKLIQLDPAWYGFDPIHVRRSRWPDAWRKILETPPEVRPQEASALESIRLYRMRPERRWWFGVEQLTPQSGVPLQRGGRVWLY